MVWNWTAWWVCVLWVLVSGAVAYREGTLSRRGWRRVRMGFLEQGGMWGDLLLVSAINALIVPYFVWDEKIFMSAVIVGFGTSSAAHRAWGRHLAGAGVTSHLWPDLFRRSWLDDLSIAGMLHFAFTWYQVVLFGFYLFSPLPERTIWTVSVLAVVHLTFGTVLPCRAAHARWFVPGTWRALVVQWSVVAGAALFKLMYRP